MLIRLGAVLHPLFPLRRLGFAAFLANRVLAVLSEAPVEVFGPVGHVVDLLPAVNALVEKAAGAEHLGAVWEVEGLGASRGEGVEDVWGC